MKDPISIETERSLTRGRHAILQDTELAYYKKAAERMAYAGEEMMDALRDGKPVRLYDGKSYITIIQEPKPAPAEEHAAS